MRVAAFFLVASILFIGGAEARTLVNTDYATVRADMNSSESCNVGVDDELCAATWSTNDTLEPGDDAISFNKTVDQVSVRLWETPDGHPQSLEIQPGSWSVGNPVFMPLNETWKDADAALPAAAHDYVSLDSTYRPPYDTFAPTWGLSVVVKYPAGIPGDATGGKDSERVWVLCWDIGCSNARWGYFTSDEHRIQADPGIAGTEPWGSDEWMENDFAGPYGAITCKRAVQEIECPDWAIAPVRTTAAIQVNASEDFTPDVQTFARTDHASLKLGPSRPQPASATGSFAGGVGHRDVLPAKERRPESSTLHPEPATIPPGSPPFMEPVHSSSPLGASATSVSWASIKGPLPVASRIGAMLVAGAAVLCIIGGLFLYTRLQRGRILEHTIRRRIYEAICQNPGIRVGTLASRLELHHNAVLYHVRILEQAGLVKAAGLTKRQYVPAGKLSRDEEARCTGALAVPSARAVYEHLRTHGPADLSALALGTGLGYSTVSEVVAVLCSASLTERYRRGKLWIVQATSPSMVSRRREGHHSDLVSH